MKKWTSALLVPFLLTLAACGRALGIHETRVHESEADANAGPAPSRADANPSGMTDGGQATPDQTTKPPTDGGTAVDERTEPPPPAPDSAADGGLPSRPPVDASGPPPTDVHPTPDVRPPDPVDATPPDAKPMDAKPQDTGPPLCSSATLPTAVTLNVQAIGGSCSLPASNIPTLFAAVDMATYGDSSGCGGCIELANKDHRVVVQVVDKSGASGSTGNAISISQDALTMLAGPMIFSTNAQWRWVPCPTTGLITAALRKSSSEQNWAVLFVGYTNRLAKVEYIGKGGVWIAVDRLNYNYFEAPKPDGLPIKFRLTDVHNNVVETGPVAWAPDQTTPVSLGVQFPPQCSLH